MKTFKEWGTLTLFVGTPGLIMAIFIMGEGFFQMALSHPLVLLAFIVVPSLFICPITLSILHGNDAKIAKKFGIESEKKQRSNY